MPIVKLFSEQKLDEIGLLTRSTRYRLRREGKFPQPIKISKGKNAYTEEQIESYLKSCTIDDGGGDDR